jgi:hypothetical protein
VSRAAHRLILLASLWIVPAVAGDDRDGRAPLEPIGRLEHPAIREASGIVASRRHAGVFWVHNDSGNPPALFAVKRDGTLLREYRVAAPNLDWEDIASDDDGHLYVGDIGNNTLFLRVRAIYRVDEPDPAAVPPGGTPLAVTKSWHYTFPPGGRFDAEGLFLDGSRAVVVSKSQDGRPAGLFAMPLDADAPLGAPVVLRPIGTLAGFVEPATGAALAPGGRRLAVCSYKVVRVYGREAAGTDAWELLATLPYEADGVEAVTWDGDDLILASEGRSLYRIGAATWRRFTGKSGPPPSSPDPERD